MLESSRMRPLRSKKFLTLLVFVVAGLGFSTAVLASNGPPPPAKASPRAAHRLVAAAPKPAAKSIPSSRRFAVIIGIDYDHYDFGAVRYADHDAASVYQMLTTEMGFPRQNIAYLINGQATGANIISALNWISTNPAAVSGSEVVFFYSGHGLRNGPGDGLDIPGLSPGYALVPFDFYNFNYKTGAGLIWDWDVAARLGKIHPAKMWVSFDSCFSGGFIRPGITGPNRVVTASSQADQLSNELPQAQHGVFSNFMDDSVALGMSVEQAYLEAYPRSLPYSQTPQISDEYPGGLQLGP